jgi:diguanylate cyclase (GGDEF)-like protein
MGLKRFIWVLTAGMALVVILFGAMTYGLLQNYLASLGAGEDKYRVGVVREVLEQRLGFYHDVVLGYARDQNVRDLLAFGDENEAVAWSARVRASLPQAIGAALFSAGGELLGDPSAQRVGKQCLLDLGRRVRGEAHSLLPLHDDVPALAHFDVSATVRDEGGETLGIIFVSFSVRELLAVLDRVSSEREAAALVDPDSDSIIATSPNWNTLRDATLVSTGVAGSSWQLQLRLAHDSLTPALPGVGALILSGAVAVIVLMVLSGRFLTRRYFQEVDAIQSMLGRILAGEQLSEQDLRSASHFFPGSQQLRAAVERLGDLHHSLQRDVHLDELTGLANRRAFDQRLDELLALGRHQPGAGGFCLVLLDLDGLKEINDRYGHAVGDQLLRGLGLALQSRVRGTDLVSRWGGDEFAALLPQMTLNQMDFWLERVRRALSEQLADIPQLRDTERYGVSGGYVYVSPGDGREAKVLLKEADERLYRDKAQRRRLVTR